MIKATTTPRSSSQAHVSASPSPAAPKETPPASATTKLPPSFNTPFFRAVVAFEARANRRLVVAEKHLRDTAQPPRRRAAEAIWLVLDAMVQMLLRWGSPEAEMAQTAAFDLHCIANGNLNELDDKYAVLKLRAASPPKPATPATATPTKPATPAPTVERDISKVRSIALNKLDEAERGQLLAHALGYGDADDDPVRCAIHSAAFDLESWRVVLIDIEHPIADPENLVASVSQLQRRLMVTAELHTRQLAERDAEIAALQAELAERAA